MILGKIPCAGSIFFRPAVLAMRAELATAVSEQCHFCLDSLCAIRAGEGGGRCSLVFARMLGVCWFLCLEENYKSSEIGRNY
jgi:hypothetical protein